MAPQAAAPTAPDNTPAKPANPGRAKWTKWFPRHKAEDPQKAFIDALESAGIKGKIHKPHTVEYDWSVIPWNRRTAWKPAAVVVPKDANDVSLAVKVAAEHKVPVQPRSGGHSYAAYSLGGQNGSLCIDLAELSTVVVDKKTWQATIGGGARLGHLSDELQKQGNRTFAHGTCSSVGIGGHATVGGQGVLSRIHGLTLDAVIEAEVVIASGEIVRANQTENSDLFWAIRGAGASFGIVTSFVFKTWPAPTEVTHYSFEYVAGTPEELADVFIRWQEFVSSEKIVNDRKFNSIIEVKPNGVLIQGSRIGKQKELESTGFLKLGHKAHRTHIWVVSWAASVLYWFRDEINNLAGVTPLPMYMKSMVVPKSGPLTREAVTAFVESVHSLAPHNSVIIFLADLQGGATSDTPQNGTAYAHRDALYTLCGYSIVPMLPFPEVVLQYMTAAFNAITTAQPAAAKYGVYPGYVDPFIPPSEAGHAYWGDNYPRLLQIKAKYDPNQVFYNPQSVGAELKQ